MLVAVIAIRRTKLEWSNNPEPHLITDHTQSLTQLPREVVIDGHNYTVLIYTLVVTS
jgi:hypothetical protein